MKLSEKVKAAQELLYEVEVALQAIEKDESKKDIFKTIRFGNEQHNLMTNLFQETVLLEKLEVRLLNHNL